MYIYAVAYGYITNVYTVGVWMNGYITYVELYL